MPLLSVIRRSSCHNFRVFSSVLVFPFGACLNSSFSFFFFLCIFSLLFHHPLLLVPVFICFFSLISIPRLLPSPPFHLSCHSFFSKTLPSSFFIFPPFSSLSFLPPFYLFPPFLLPSPSLSLSTMCSLPTPSPLYPSPVLFPSSVFHFPSPMLSSSDPFSLFCMYNFFQLPLPRHST